jgi:conjugative relaxase-like TrwC/TraI family protein
VVTPLSPAAAAYYFRGQGGGRWVGRGSELLGLSGAVDRRQLVAVMRGCHPTSGHFLPTTKPSRRRAGWDLVLAAPKSVSLLAALAASGGADIAGAHRTAVDEVVGDFERRLLSLRRTGAPGGMAPSAGLVAAAFEHHFNAAGEPHLHTHLLACNLGCDPGGRWSAISPSWWTARQSHGG